MYLSQKTSNINSYRNKVCSPLKEIREITISFYTRVNGKTSIWGQEGSKNFKICENLNRSKDFPRYLNFHPNIKIFF